MLPFTLALLLGILLGLLLEIPAGYWLCCIPVFLTLSAAIVWRSRNISLALCAALIAFVAIGAYRTDHLLARELRRSVHQLGGRVDSARVIGRAASVVARPRSIMIQLSHAVLITGDTSLACNPLVVNVVIRKTAQVGVRTGDQVAAEGALLIGAPSTTHAELVPMLVNRVACTLLSDTSSIAVIKRPRISPSELADRIRTWIASAFSEHTDRDGAALCKALVLGERGEFSEQFRDALRISGLSHVFALSGINVGLLVSLAWLLLTVLMLPRTIRLWILLAFVVFYAEIGRHAPSLVRASLMCGIYLTGLLLHRRAGWVNIIAAAAFFELLWRPLDVLDPGFELSYLAVVGLGLGASGTRRFWPRVVERRRAAMFLLTILLATLVTQIATAPLTAYLFNRIPLLGAIGNLVAIPGFAILLAWSVILLILAAVYPPAAAVAGEVVDVFSGVLGHAVHFFAGLPFSSVTVNALPAWSISLLFIAAALILMGIRPMRGRLAATGLLIALNVLVWMPTLTPQAVGTTIAFLDVGNGDATLISEEDHHVLVDAGASTDSWSAATGIIGFLRQRGIEHLDALILTHPDNDHIGGAVELLEQIPVSLLCTNGDSSLTSSAIQVDLAARRRNVGVRVLRSGDVISLSKTCSLAVMWPDTVLRENVSSDNQRSLVLRLDAYNCSALLMADADTAVEELLLPLDLMQSVDLLKIGHHGSRSSSSARFLKQVSPGQAVISAGRANRYGHPSPIVIARLDSLGIPWVVTSRSGTIEFRAGPTGWLRVESRAAKLAKTIRVPYD